MFQWFCEMARVTTIDEGNEKIIINQIAATSSRLCSLGC